LQKRRELGFQFRPHSVAPSLVPRLKAHPPRIMLRTRWHEISPAHPRMHPGGPHKVR
jgi:hypothetical protein